MTQRACDLVASASEPRQMSVRELLAAIVGEHHGRLRALLPMLGARADKVARLHRARSPGLIALAAAVYELADVLGPHLDHEDEVLFPSLVGDRVTALHIAHELRDSRRDHLQLAVLLARVREISVHFSVPEWACRRYRTLAGDLAGLDHDLLERLHLEDTILLPRFLSLGPEEWKWSAGGEEGPAVD